MSPPGERNPVVVFFGLLLIAVGGLIALASGACTLAVTLGGLSQAGGDGFVALLLLCLAVGAVPMIFGVGLVVVGSLMCRRRVTRRDRPPPP